MSIFGAKKIGLKIGLKDNISDPWFLEFMKNRDYTEEEGFEFESATYGSRYSPMAERIIDFICEYKGGVLHPDKCGLWEPLKYVFDVSDKNRYINWIANPGELLFMMKRRRFDIFIKNYFIMPRTGKIVLKRPEHLCEVSFFFRKLKALDYDFLKTLLRDYCDYLGTNRGVMFDTDTDEILLDLSNPERIGTHIVSRDPFAQC